MINRSIWMLLVTGGAVWVPWVLWITIKSYVLSSPDSKFGATGGVLFVALIWGVAALLAGIASAIVGQGIHLLNTNRERFNYRIAALLSGIVLSVGAKYLPLITPIGGKYIGDFYGSALSWFLICLAVCCVLEPITLLRKPNPYKASPRQGQR